MKIMKQLEHFGVGSSQAKPVLDISSVSLKT